jgi:hypothetical protein
MGNTTLADSLLEIYINGVSKQIEKIIGRKILAADYTEKHKGTDGTELVLNNYPINSITSVSYIDDGTEIEALDEYDYELDEESGILYKEDGWLLRGFSSYMSDKIDFPKRHIKVVYNGGFEEVPADLKLICLRYISDNYAMDNSQGGILKSYGISDLKLEWRDGIKFSEDDMKIILSYKGVRF